MQDWCENLPDPQSEWTRRSRGLAYKVWIGVNTVWHSLSLLQPSLSGMLLREFSWTSGFTATQATVLLFAPVPLVVPLHRTRCDVMERAEG